MMTVIHVCERRHSDASWMGVLVLFGYIVCLRFYVSWPWSVDEAADINARNEDLAPGELAVDRRRGRGRGEKAVFAWASSHFCAMRWAASNALSTNAREGDV